MGCNTSKAATVEPFEPPSAPPAPPVSAIVASVPAAAPVKLTAPAAIVQPVDLGAPKTAHVAPLALAPSEEEEATTLVQAAMRGKQSRMAAAERTTKVQSADVNVAPEAAGRVPHEVV